MKAFWGLVFLFSTVAVSQTIVPDPGAAPKAGGLKSFSIDPNKKNPDFELRSLEPVEAAPLPLTKSQREDAEEIIRKDEALKNPAHWSRPAIGFWGGLTNNGLSSALYKRTQDDVLAPDASELGFGIGTNIDFGTPAMNDESFRLQIGLYKVSIKPAPAIALDYAPGQLENSMTLFNLGLLYRISTAIVDYQTLWYGFGLQMNYIFATSRPGQGKNPVSNVLNSYGFSPILAVGADIPISSYNDLSFDLQWHPIRGFAVHAGLRTSL